MDWASAKEIYVQKGIPVACVLLFPPEEDALADARLNSRHVGQTRGCARPNLQDVQLGSGVGGI